jgi:hypothetical protein
MKHASPKCMHELGGGVGLVPMLLQRILMRICGHMHCQKWWCHMDTSTDDGCPQTACWLRLWDIVLAVACRLCPIMGFDVSQVAG